MIRLAIVLILMVDQATPVQEVGYQSIHRSKKIVVRYSVISKKGEYFMVGSIETKKTKQAVSGYNVTVVNQQIGTVSDEKGVFRISVPNKKGWIIFSRIGYNEFKIPYDVKTAVTKHEGNSRRPFQY